MAPMLARPLCQKSGCAGSQNPTRYTGGMNKQLPVRRYSKVPLPLMALILVMVGMLLYMSGRINHLLDERKACLQQGGTVQSCSGKAGDSGAAAPSPSGSSAGPSTAP